MYCAWVADQLNSSLAEEFLHWFALFTAVATSSCSFLLLLGGISEKNDQNKTKFTHLGGHYIESTYRRSDWSIYSNRLWIAAAKNKRFWQFNAC